MRLNGTESLLAPEVGMTYATPSGKQEPYYENLLSYGQAFPRWEEPQEVYETNPLREKYPLAFTQSRSRFRVHSTYSGAAWIQQLYEPHIELIRSMLPSAVWRMARKWKCSTTAAASLRCCA